MVSQACSEQQRATVVLLHTIDIWLFQRRVHPHVPDRSNARPGIDTVVIAMLVLWISRR